MSLFDRLVDEALRSQAALAPLRAVVEKELLHHDILREMGDASLLHRLTFIGGTCLRTCYGSSRLSEDLDFTGGGDFDRASLATLGRLLVERLQAKYALRVSATEPTRTTGKVATWKVQVVTRPERRDLPTQRINIDICAIPSHDRRPMLLRNPYGVDMGTAGLIVQAESREEILADKLIALALRPNRIKYRDLWDIGWLRQQGVELPAHLIRTKADDHQCTPTQLLDQLARRRQQLSDDPSLHQGFSNEMRRFLPPRIISETVEQSGFWQWLTDTIDAECQRVERTLGNAGPAAPFPM